jgi:hypothetical protein
MKVMIKKTILQKQKANITFLVMMIMFISSLLWLLVSQYVWFMIATSSLFQNYYSTYYMAYGWLEVWLTQVKYHWFWFENAIISTWSACRSLNCQTETTITSRSPVISDAYEVFNSCNTLSASWINGQWYMQLWSWDCFITPLYVDDSTDFNPILYTNLASSTFLTTYSPSLYNTYSWTVWTGELYSIRIIDENLNNLSSVLEPETWIPTPYSFWTAMPPYSWTSSNYFIVANPSASNKQFCMELGWWWELPMKFVNVLSIAQDGNNTIALNAIKNNELPSFLCYWAINP